MITFLNMKYKTNLCFIPKDSIQDKGSPKSPKTSLASQTVFKRVELERGGYEKVFNSQCSIVSFFFKR